MNKTNNSAGTGRLSKSNSADVIIDAKLEEEHQLCATTHCPGCGHNLQPKPDWVGLPAGVKFDPTDQELIEHLEAKVQGKESKSHPLIDEFIPTIQGDDGICYTHPENLPGVTRDGLSRHFFHRPSKAYTTGTRKRRKIQTECDDVQGGGETRWHKTGKTRPVMVNGKQKGCKKILVLYTNFGKNRKPEKTNWVMHQYHLGIHEEEKEGELVASKIFYQTQPRQCNWSERANNPSSSIKGSSGGGGRGSDPFISTRRDSIGGRSGREMIAPREELSVAVGGTMSNYDSLDNIQQLKGDPFNYLRYRKSFDELTNMVSAAHPPEEEKGNQTIKERMSKTCIAREGGAAMSEEEHNREMAYHLTTANDQNQPIATTTSSFNISRPSLPISTIISPPSLQHSSVNILHHDSFHVSTLLLQNQNFQQQQQEHHHKLGGRAVSVSASASGLEELIMGCTSTDDDDVKQESSSHPNPQEMEWLKYSTSFWPDPDNPDHHP